MNNTILRLRPLATRVAIALAVVMAVLVAVSVFVTAPAEAIETKKNGSFWVAEPPFNLASWLYWLISSFR